MDADAMPRLLMAIAGYGYLALFLALLLEELGVPLPLPGDLVLLFAGYLVGRGLMRFDIAVLTIVLAAFTGASLLYLVSRRYGRGAVARYGRYLHVTPERLAWAETRLRRFGPAAVLVARIVPGMRIYTSILAGVGGVSYRRFAAALAPAAASWAVVFVFLGSKVGERWDEVAALLEHHTVRLGLVGGILLALGLVGSRWWRRRSARTGTARLSRDGPTGMRAASLRVIDVLRRHPVPLIAVVGTVAGLGAQYAVGERELGRGLLLATLLLGGFPVVRGTLAGVPRGRFAADLVASLAIVGAALTGEYLAGAVIVLMQSGGEALEAYGVRRASATLGALLARAPRVAHRREGDRLAAVPVHAIGVGDILIVRPGDLVPVDALVEDGAGSVDESALTGEPVPRPVGAGDELMSGAVCLDGALEVRALRLSRESQYERIVAMVRTAQDEKPPIGRLADRYAVVFTPLTLVVATAAFLITGQPAAVLAVLVVATPCPLILATPVAVMSGINRAAGRGIVVKSGAALEQLGQATAVVFDKTGTLTTGAPVVDGVVPLDGLGAAEALRLGAGLEQLSTHPMARALVAAGRARWPGLSLPVDLVEAPGQGVSGRVDGRLVAVGSASFAAAHGLASPAVLERARRGGDGASTAFVAVDGRAVALVVFADPLRPGVSALIEELPALGVGETAMLTGDDEPTARRIAAEAGITTVRANLLPGDKVAAVQELLARHRSVAMVGDGINDAPALATATVGIAMGARGAAVSAEAADVVVVADDLGRVAEAIRIGRRTLAVARQSIWIGMGGSGALMVVAAFGLIPPTLGAGLQEVLDAAVILNALRR